MDHRGSFFFLLLVFYLLLNSQSHAPLVAQDRERQRELERERQALRLLNESSYGDLNPEADRWLPYHGFRKNDSYAWSLLGEVQDRARDQLQSIVSNAGFEPPSPGLNLSQLPLPVYQNVTGKLQGDWVRRKLAGDRPPLNTTAIALENEYFTNEFSQNVTGNSGTFYLDLREGGGEELRLRNGEIREIRAAMAVESGDFWGTTWHLSLYGVHFPETGAVVLTTSSEKFGGVFALPHLALSSDGYDLSHKLLVKSLSDAISEKHNRPPTILPWPLLVGTEQVEFPSPKCEHIVYLQQHPVATRDYLMDKSIIHQVEQELRYPMGAPIPSPPLMAMSAVVFSPDCGYILETKGTPEFPPTDSLYLTGLKLEEFGKYSARIISVMSAFWVAQIALLLRQIKVSSTPSTRSRVSFYTIALMAFGDAFVLVFVLLELYPAVSFLIMTTASFLTFLSVSYIGMKFMMEIWAVQAPERREQERREQERRSNPPTPSVRPGDLPLPVTAARMRDSGATPIILTPDQDPPEEEEEAPPARATATPSARDARSDVGAMYARFYFILFVTLIVSIWSFMWPNQLAALYARVLGFIYVSFWTPQIYRNVMRNCRKALRWDFVVGQSFLRLFPFMYFLTVRGNVLFVRPDVTTALVLAGWVWIQVWVLASQDILGPRFFIPRGWAPPAYDYHPLVRDAAGSDDLESGGVLPIEALRADERDISIDDKGDDKHRPKDKKKAIFDCAICMQEIEVPVLAASTGSNSVTDGATTILSRRAYMVTPCRHIFHSTCLESWMRLRLQCPICRESIPPV
ncbi:putative RING finger ubiquitin ligase [Aspergillus campestris IBT 28561]|uniref:DSC E3 ubiquitin ligase complex subunit A n=1 Tax=Aspergillus campestris (strain IBT 28561) TaxID=1392248 RepID=A0A2I1DFX3_ASPC2|nr:putative RING finger ubiquitin ligase [Aspergillus campestris IBT 28561]PKY08777.1 putative RING finger ubiquitin ligase [Aspergillus campestris IBT 28561]